MDFGQLFCSVDSAVETKELVVAEKKKDKQKLCTVHHLVKDKKLFSKLNTAQCSYKMKVRGKPLQKKKILQK